MAEEIEFNFIPHKKDEIICCNVVDCMETQEVIEAVPVAVVGFAVKASFKTNHDKFLIGQCVFETMGGLQPLPVAEVIPHHSFDDFTPVSTTEFLENLADFFGPQTAKKIKNFLEYTEGCAKRQKEPQPS
jgi:hypothetical protein